MKQESNESVYMIHSQRNYSLLHEKGINLFLYFFKIHILRWWHYNLITKHYLKLWSTNSNADICRDT